MFTERRPTCYISTEVLFRLNALILFNVHVLFGPCAFCSLKIFKNMFIDFREREDERETHIDQLLPLHALTGDGTCNLAMCPDGESNLQPLGP